LDNWGTTTPIGEQLRSARRSRGIELEQVEEQTKIRARFLRAMEEDRWEILPGPAFARAFLRTYADLLELDSEELVEQYRRRGGEPAAPEDVPQPAPSRRLGRGRRLDRGLGERAPRGPRRWVTVAGVVLAAALAALVVVGLVGDSGDEAGEPGEAAGGASSKGPKRDGEPRQQQAQAPPRATLRLTTTASVWVCLVDAEGNALIEGVTLPPGEQQGPFRAGGLELSTGNGGLEIEANGEPVPIPGAAEPLGYRITPEGTQELDPTERPSCT
jgi:cytoskeleton protein RodZ